MKFNYQRLARVAVPLTVALLLCISPEPSLARPQSGGGGGGPISKGIGGIVGAASGAIAGGVAGANAGANAAANGAEANSSVSASMGGSSGSGGASLSANANLSTGSGSSSGGSGGSSSGGSGGSLSASGSASLDSSSGGSMSAQASVSMGSSTPKPEGIVDKMKEIIKGGKEMIKDSVDKLTKDDKKDETKISAEASASGSSSGGSVSGGASLSVGGGSSGGSGSSSGSSSGGSGGSGGGSSMSASANMQSSGGQASGSASASLSIGSTTPKPEGLLDKMSKFAEKGKEAIKDLVDTKKDSGSQGMSGSVSGNIGPISASASGSVGGSGGGQGGGMSANANINIGGGGGSGGDGMKKFDQRGEKKEEGPIDKVQKLVAKGTDAVRETARIIEDKANTVSEKIGKVMDDTIKKPMQSVSGSGQLNSEGQLAARAQATSQLKGTDRDKHLIEVKKEQESKLQRPSSLKEVVTEAKTKGIIPQNEDRSVLRGNHADEKSVAVEVFDKAHEMSKIPVESVLKPIDKMLGYEKDPLMRIYDNSHEILRRPLSLVSKPVESVLTGAFKTTEEAKKDSEKLLATKNDQERREAILKEERAKKEDRSVVGSIADKTVELATKPIEIVLKPFDHMLGFDKDGKKNPLLRALDEIYGLSKAPVDALAKPFESILKKMADGEQMYQVSVRFNGGSSESSDPKLVTRLADGALNVADRVLTKPLEIVMKPLNHALGYDEPGKKNPIMEAAHSLKNATKVGVELFTKPIDRIIKEIADIGENKSDSEREADFERQKQEASRLVAALDKLHEVIQYPFEIVLRPMGKALGTTKGGKKDPLLRAWDVIHQVVRTPIQVISKPVEDAILGDRAKKNMPKQGINVQASAQGGQQGGQGQAQASIGANIGPIKAGASISLKDNKKGGGSNETPKKNVIIDSIKTVEKFATKPIDVITSPIRKLILGEDGEKVGSEIDKNNREIQARAAIGGSSKAQASLQIKQGGGKHPDKIMTTLEKMNNVILKPLEEITQPISDILSSEKKLEVKAQVSGQKPQQQQQQQQQQQPKGFSASAQAQIKKN